MVARTWSWAAAVSDKGAIGPLALVLAAYVRMRFMRRLFARAGHVRVRTTTNGGVLDQFTYVGTYLLRSIAIA